MAYQQDFTYVTGTEPHRTRTREIVKAHPEVKKLITKNPMTFVWILGCVSMQIGMAYLVKDQAWWVILAAAWLIGAFPTHTLFVCIHEAAHNLIFKNHLGMFMQVSLQTFHHWHQQLFHSKIIT
jgi:sphingolipid delta-4 desaturase